MIRIKASEARAQTPKTAALVVVLLLAALALSAAAVAQVLAEYRMLGEWVVRPGGVSAAEIDTLRRDIGARIIVRSVAVALLLGSALVLFWLQLRQLALLRALSQVKVLALDILASMDQGVITTDLDDVVTGINSAAIRILELRTDCIGKPLAEIPASVPLVALAAQVAERNAAVWDRDFALPRGGHERRIRADAHVLKDSAGKALGCVILMRDVSDRVRMEERVQRMERYLSLGTLASGLHHEIKNPLTALNIHVQLLEKRLSDPAVRKPVDELTGVLKSEIQRLNGVLDSFRDFASLQRLCLRTADVQAVLDETARLIGPQAAEQHVRVVTAWPVQSPPKVSLDYDKFKQAILNLVINALEAMPNGGELALGALARDGELVVEVRDTGPGIPAEVQRDLFKPYVTSKARGSGMGLALAEKIVSQHGGRISFRTGARGTTFTIALPLDPASGGNGEP